MRELLRKLAWWREGRRKEHELREELQFHLEEEEEDRRAAGLPADQAKRAAALDLGNQALLQEDTRTLWTWTPLEQLAQDLRFALRTMLKNRAFTGLAALSLALGIGANTAIYSFMDAILLRSLPVAHPESLVVLKWRSPPFAFGGRRTGGSEFVMRSINGTFYRDPGGVTGAIFPFPAFELLQQAHTQVFSSLFAYHPTGNLTVMVKGESEQAKGHYVSGDFFKGLAVPPAAGRLILGDDDKAGAPPVAVLSMGYSRRRFGGPAEAAGQEVLVNNLAFTVIGVTPSEFFGVDPGAAPDVYLPMQAGLLLDRDAATARLDPNYYWVQMMGRLREGTSQAQAQAALETPFATWVAPTAENDRERANLPRLRLEEGAGGLDSLRRHASKPLYVLQAMVGLILAMACANTANLLLARASARRREMAVRLSIGAGRSRLVRQLLTETVLLATISGALGVLFAVAGIEVLTLMLANGPEAFALQPDLNGRVLGVTMTLSLLCGILFGLAPALQSTRPAIMPSLKDRSAGPHATRTGARRPSLIQALVVAQIAISLLLLVGAGLFVRTLRNLQSVQLGFNKDGLLLFDVNAPQAGYPAPKVADFYADLRDRFRQIPGIEDATLSHSSLIKAGRGHPILVDGQPAMGTRLLHTGPEFFKTMQIPILQGRAIDEGDRQGTRPVVVVSELFAQTFLKDENPLGRHIALRPGRQADPVDLEVVGVAKTTRYGPLKYENPPVVYIPYAQVLVPPLQGMTYALRTEGDPMSLASVIRQLVNRADARVPVTNLRTQSAEIDQSINQEIVFARLCSSFAALALVIACVGLYATTAYAVARRTNEIGIRMALGARSGGVVWMVLRDVCALASIGVAISLPVATSASKLIQSFLFGMQPEDPRALTLAVLILLTAALLAGYAPARRASRVDPLVALRHE
jgi:predicted permease